MNHRSLGNNLQVPNVRKSGSNFSMSPSPPPPCPPPNLPVWTSLAMNSNFGSAPPPAHQGIRSTLKSHPTIPPQLPPRPKKGVSPLHLNLIPPPCIPLSTPSPNGNANNASIKSIAHMSKYNQLLLVLDELNKDVRPAYAGSKASVERLRRGISHARLLVHESLIETERGSRN